MAKKLLTLDDLVQFCSSNNLLKFNAQESGYQLAVQVPASFEEESRDDSSTMYVKVKAFHTNRNRNGSSVTEDAAKKCMSGIKYKPILANFCEVEDENGDIVKDFTSHDMEIKEDGTVEYLERQVGCFTADEPWMEDEDDGRKFVYAYAAIPREYSDTAAILERKGGTKVSVELGVNAMEFDAQEKLLVLTDIEVMGLTFLGEAVGEGMLGARADITDFSVENNAVKFDIDHKLVEVIEKLDTVLSHFNIDNSTRKEDNTLQEFDENEIKKIPNDDDTAPVVEDTEDTGSTPEEESPTPETPDEGESTIPDEEGEDSTPTEPEESESNDNEEETADTFSLKYSVEMGEVKKEFGLSLSDKQNAMYQLINETYGEQDNDWYDVDVYDDDADRYVVMHGFWTDKHYKQSYKKKKECYSLTGDRVEVFAKYLTNDEITQLESLKSSYAEVSEKLGKYESEPEKMQILESEDYGYVASTEEFEELKKQENHFDLTVDEVKAKADGILLEYAKKGSFATKEDKVEVGKKTLPVMPKGATKKSRYGKRFTKED